jgi:hypothetical protein
MTSENDLQELLDKISAEDVRAQIDIAPVVPETSAKQKNDATADSRNFEFRPLTEEEKEEFVNSLDAKGKQIYAELAAKVKRLM